jgi:hypothetical protein
VHLAVDPDRGHVDASGPVAGGPDRRHDRLPPCRRVGLRPPGVRTVDRVAGRRLGQEAAVGAQQDRLDTAGAQVQAQERPTGHRTRSVPAESPSPSSMKRWAARARSSPSSQRLRQTARVLDRVGLTTADEKLSKVTIPW